MARGGKAVLKQSMARLRSIRPSQIRRDAQRPFHLVLIANGLADREALRRVFLPEQLSPEDHRLALAHLADGHAVAGQPLQVCTPAAADACYVVIDPSHPAPGFVALLRAYPEYGLALGRSFPPLREPLAQELIRAVAARNAAVAAVSALPEVIPTPLSILLALGEMGSDTVLITANQMLLAFELAALCGAEVGWRAQSRSLAAVAAGGLGWRTLAREIVGLIPAGVGLAAKAGIAYSGTVAVGAALWRTAQPRRAQSPVDAFLATRRQTA